MLTSIEIARLIALRKSFDLPISYLLCNRCDFAWQQHHILGVSGTTQDVYQYSPTPIIRPLGPINDRERLAVCPEGETLCNCRSEA